MTYGIKNQNLEYRIEEENLQILIGEIMQHGLCAVKRMDLC